MRAVIYLRQSLDREGDQLAIERQRAECQRLCQSRGWTTVTEIIDNNRSASKGPRPGFARIIDMIERNTLDCVVILRIDRLMRLNDELELLINLVERHPVKIVTVEGDIDITTPQGRMVARVLVSVARNEMETKSARHKLANRQRAQAGQPHSSRRPYGYNTDLRTLYEPEAAVVREMGRRVLSGHSFREVAWWANEQGHRTSGGKAWLSIVVRLMLERPRYAGIRRYDGVDYPGDWEPVFDHQTWQRLQYVIQSRRTGSGIPGMPATARKYLLTGIAVCGKCGTYLNGNIKRDASRPGARPGKLTPRYICRSWGDTQRKHGCGGIRRNALALDHFIREAVIYRLDTPELADMIGANKGEDHELSKLMESRSGQQQRKDQLVKDYATGLLTRDELAQAKLEAQSALDALDAQIAARGHETHVSGLLSAGQTVRDAWMVNQNDWRRNLLQLLIAKIVVLPEGDRKPVYVADGVNMRFDPNRIQIDWKC